MWQIQDELADFLPTPWQHLATEGRLILSHGLKMWSVTVSGEAPAMLLVAWFLLRLYWDQEVEVETRRKARL